MSPDYSILFAQPIEMRFNEMLEGTKAQLAVKIFGTDYDVLEKLGEQIKGILEKTPGVSQVEYETEGRTPQLQIDVKRDALQRYSLQAGEVNKAVNAALAGQVVGIAVEGNRRRDIVVRMPEACAPTMSRSSGCRCASARSDSSGSVRLWISRR